MSPTLRKNSVECSSVEIDQQGNSDDRLMITSIQARRSSIYSTVREGVRKHLITSVDTFVNCGKCQVGQVLTFAGMRLTYR